MASNDFIPKLNEIVKGRLIGKNPSQNFMWHPCDKCGKPSWVAMIAGQIRSHRCRKCSIKYKGHRATNWKGGRHFASEGYIKILLYEDDPYFAMAPKKKHYVPEHRYVMAKHLGRCLTKQEVVHHINGIRDDNRIENLELMPDPGKHFKFITCTHCELRKEIRLLRLQIGMLREQLQGRLV